MGIKYGAIVKYTADNCWFCFYEGSQENESIKKTNEFVPAFSMGDRTRSFLKIQDGCDYSCTFCTIPLARGQSRSDTIENVVAEATSLGNKGIKEIVPRPKIGGTIKKIITELKVRSRSGISATHQKARLEH